jgi:hypothetical protein
MFNDILYDEGAPEDLPEDMMPFDLFHIIIEDEEDDDY